MKRIDPMSWKSELALLREKGEAFARGEIKKGDYKGFSGRYGTYAQKDPSVNMLRLRMTGGRVTKQKLAFVADTIRRYGVGRVHFTTCQTIQLHDLAIGDVCDILESALEVGIVPMGGGGDYPRNAMCSPLSGVEQGEYFDVLPYAEAAAEYLMGFIDAERMPRKLKCGFSSGPANVTHATFRDIGFVARPDGCFDVYTAGGLGNNPRFGVQVAEAVVPDRILYYIKAMWLTFRAYGNYENRGKARTRYMQEACGGAEAYRAAYLAKLDEVLASDEDLALELGAPRPEKAGDGSTACGPRVIPQKQSGLYAVEWHPLGGDPAPETLCALSDLLSGIENAELRLSPDETAYVIDLTGKEAEAVVKLLADSAETEFERSEACIGSSICQVGLRDSQAVLRACISAVRQAGIAADALPRIHITGCPSSCAAPQTAEIGLRGTVKNRLPAFLITVGGCALQGSERMGEELGTVLESDLPALFVKLGAAVQSTGMGWYEWRRKQPEALAELAAEYIT